MTTKTLTAGKTATYAEAYAVAAEQQKHSICQLLKWNTMQYAEYQYAIGLQYLYWYLPCDDNARFQLERSKLFWNWFKSQWAAHDTAFIDCDQIERHGHDLLLSMYAALHCPRTLAKEVKPNSTVLDTIKTGKSYELYTKG